MTIKKILLCAVVAGSSGPALATAQSSVTLYGLVDVNIESFDNAPGGRSTGMRSGGQSGTRWGLRGSEDLGNGLKAVFQLESGFSIRSGQGDASLFQRTAAAGLAGSWGELTFGRQYTSSFLLATPFDPLGFSPQYSPSGRLVPVRADNAVRYSGRFGGVRVMGYYAFRNQADQISANASPTGSAGAAASYDSGVWGAVAAYDLVRGPVNSAVGDTDNYLVGAHARLGDATLRAMYRYRTVEQVADSDIKSHMYALAFAYDVTPAATAELAYYREKFRSRPAGYLGTTDDTWQQYVLRGTYKLSKRTNLYALAAHARNGALNLGSHGEAGGPPYTLAAGKTHQTGLAIGMRHAF
ncbi:porin [Verticiella sediminum]|uniref:Porin n=1 Tax=Verticiella sediminum TaxID=1247510 RepID=A0A556B0B5_9BURK|nr:porin [Verticiella sediminum]TSH98626.1 porin [Verticiella sediminum]